ncbi:MAG: nitrite reductase small subunit NirD [Pseudomonadales bacterium]|nr:nitrite reductase small subunit NirD [Pseudomonadales bacterium]
MPCKDRSALTVIIPKHCLRANAGVCALVADVQVALFYLPDEEPQLYALGNWDPLGKANVLSRGIVGDLDGELVVASPLYKQHFKLRSGQCLEEPAVTVPVFQTRIEGDKVLVSLQAPR